MTTNKDTQLEALYGPLAPYSEYTKGAHIRYRTEDKHEYIGVIVWITGPGTTARGHNHPTQYIVEKDGAGDSLPDIVYPSDIIEA
jgi:hypothetical protein